MSRFTTLCPDSQHRLGGIGHFVQSGDRDLITDSPLIPSSRSLTLKLPNDFNNVNIINIIRRDGVYNSYMNSMVSLGGWEETRSRGGHRTFKFLSARDT